MFKIQGTQLHLSTTYHPQTDDQTEVFKKCLETYLRFFSLEKKKQWAQWLPLVEWWYNTSYHIATRVTDFEVVYGQNPPSVLSYFLGVSNVQAVEEMITVREDILHTLKENLVMDQNRMKNKQIKVTLNMNLYKWIKCFFDCSLTIKIPSRMTIFRNWHPNFMVLIPFSSMWDRWPVS
jgi:hypothetical protein